MGGTGSSSLRSWRTYRVTARARCLNTAEGVSSGVVTTLLLGWRTATTRGALTPPVQGYGGGPSRRCGGLVAHAGPRLGLDPKPLRQAPYAAKAARSIRQAR